MDKIPLISFFVAGFLLSRLIIKVNIPPRIVAYFLNKESISLTRIVAYLAILSTFLSFVIPNAITVLAILPISVALIEHLSPRFPEDKHLPTIFALAIIYGANIGGMSSLTATPANGILIAFLEAKSVALPQSLSYAGWLMWGIPTVIAFLIVTILLLSSFFATFRKKYKNLNTEFIEVVAKHDKENYAIKVSAAYFIYCFVLSMLQNYFPQSVWLFNSIAVVVLLTLCYYLFIFRHKIKRKDGSFDHQRLLQIKDCYSNLPTTGIVIVVVALIVGFIAYALGIGAWLEKNLVEYLPKANDSFMFYFILALTATFLTELLSNTLVQIALFSLVITFSESVGISPVPACLVVTLAATCAFMTPLATGANGLAFGGIKNVRLDKMIYGGFIMNIAGSAMIASLAKIIA